MTKYSTDDIYDITTTFNHFFICRHTIHCYTTIGGQVDGAVYSQTLTSSIELFLALVSNFFLVLLGISP